MAKTHPNDVVLVRNIDVNCDHITYDVVPKYYKETDEETGVVYQRFGNQNVEFHHAQGFTVRFAGQPHTIEPGGERKWPRMLAEHYAKHLADHILGKRELVEKKTGYITSAIERPKVLEQVLVEVLEYFQDNGPEDEGLRVLEQAEHTNSLDFGHGDFAKAAGKSTSLHEVDAGEVPNKVAGVLTTDTPQSEDDALEAAGERVEAKELPSRLELIKEAHALGIKVIPTDTRESLATKIKAF